MERGTEEVDLADDKKRSRDGDDEPTITLRILCRGRKRADRLIRLSAEERTALAAGSPYFRSLLTGGFRESSQAVVDVRVPGVDRADWPAVVRLVAGNAPPVRADDRRRGLLADADLGAALRSWGGLLYLSADAVIALTAASVAALVERFLDGDGDAADREISRHLLRHALRVRADHADDPRTAALPDPIARSAASLWAARPPGPDGRRTEREDGHEPDAEGDRGVTRRLGRHLALARLLADGHPPRSIAAGKDPYARNAHHHGRPEIELRSARDWADPLRPLEIATGIALSFTTVLADDSSAAAASPKGSAIDGATLWIPCASPALPDLLGAPVLVPSLAAFRERLSRAFPAFGPHVDSLIAASRGRAALAGGSVACAMQTGPFSRRLPDSDVDLWIFGEDEDARRAAFARTVAAAFAARPDSVARVRGSTVTLSADVPDVGGEAGSDGRDIRCRDPLSPSSARKGDSLQIIYTRCRSAEEVAVRFDFGYVEAVYDGRRVSASREALWSMASRVTRFRPLCGQRPRPARALRAQLKGFAADLGSFGSASPAAAAVASSGDPSDAIGPAPPRYADGRGGDREGTGRAGTDRDEADAVGDDGSGKPEDGEADGCGPRCRDEPERGPHDYALGEDIPARSFEEAMERVAFVAPGGREWGLCQRVVRAHERSAFVPREPVPIVCPRPLRAIFSPLPLRLSPDGRPPLVVVEEEAEDDHARPHGADALKLDLHDDSQLLAHLLHVDAALAETVWQACCSSSMTNRGRLHHKGVFDTFWHGLVPRTRGGRENLRRPYLRVTIPSRAVVIDGITGCARRPCGIRAEDHIGVEARVDIVWLFLTYILPAVEATEVRIYPPGFGRAVSVYEGFAAAFGCRSD